MLFSYITENICCEIPPNIYSIHVFNDVYICMFFQLPFVSRVNYIFYATVP